MFNLLGKSREEETSRCPSRAGGPSSSWQQARTQPVAAAPFGCVSGKSALGAAVTLLTAPGRSRATGGAGKSSFSAAGKLCWSCWSLEQGRGRAEGSPLASQVRTGLVQPEGCELLQPRS